MPIPITSTTARRSEIGRADGLENGERVSESVVLAKSVLEFEIRVKSPVRRDDGYVPDGVSGQNLYLEKPRNPQLTIEAANL